VASTHCFADDFYWIGGEGTWSDEDNWAKSSGGSELHDRVPTLLDNVFFDENSFTESNQTVQIDILNAEVRDADFSNAAFPFSLRVVAGGRNLTLFGSLKVNENFNSELANIIFQAGDDEITIETSGKRIAATVTLNSDGRIELHTSNRPVCTTLSKRGTGTLYLQDTLQTSSTIEISNGGLVSNDHAIFAPYISMGGNNTEIQLMGSHIITNQWSLSGPNTFSAGTSTISISERWGGVFSGGGYAYHHVELCGKVTVNGQNSYNKLTFCEESDIELQAGATQTTRDLVAEGSPAKPIRIASTQFENEAFIRQTNGTINASSLNLEDVHARGGATFNAAASVDLGNVKGWNITQPQPQTFYWVGGTGQWSDYQNHWAKSSGGSDFHEALPNVYDEVIFDRNSFNAGGEVVVDMYHVYAGKMDWSDIDEAVALGSFDFGNQDYINARMHVFGSLIFSDLATSSLAYIRFKSDEDEVVDGAGSKLAFSMVFYHTAQYSILAHNAEIANNIALLKEGITIIEDSVLIRDNLSMNTGTLVVDSSYISCPNISLAGIEVDITKSNIETSSWNMYNINSFKSDSSTISINNGSFWGGSLDYFDVFLCGIINIDGENTYNKLEFCPGSDVYLPAGINQSADTLVITGTAGFPVSISSRQEGRSAGLKQNGGTVEAQFMYLMDNVASGAVFNAEESIDLGNVSGWNITNPDPQKFYWVNDGGKWSDYQGHWAKSSGGNDFHDRIPGALDEVIVDNNSFQAGNANIQINQIKTYVASIEFTDADRSYSVNGGRQFWCFGDFKFNNLGSSNLSYLKFPVDTARNTLHSAGKFIAKTIHFNHQGEYNILTSGGKLCNQLDVDAGGKIEHEGDLIIGSRLNVSRGGFKSNNFNMQIPSIYFGNNNSRVTADIGSSFIEVRSWTVEQNVVFNSDTSTIHVLDPNSQAYFNGGGKDYHFVNTACIVDFTGDNYFEKLTITYGARVAIKGVQEVGELTAIGTSGNPIKITGGAFKRKPGKSVNEYLILTNNRSTGEGRLIAQRSIDNGGNDGWLIEPPEVNVDANTLNVLNGEPLCGQAIETVLSLPEGLLTTYRWFKDGLDLAHDSSTLVVSEEGIYYVELTNACGTVARSNDIEIRREGPPEIPDIDVEGETSICGNQEITVDLSTAEQPRVHYVWLKDGLPIGEDEPGIFIDEVGTYSLRLTKGECVVESTDSVVVVIKQDVPLLQELQLLGQDTICLGDSSRLFAEYEKGTTYVWQSADTTISTQANFIDIKHQGTFSLELVNGCGITDASGEEQIIVKVKPLEQDIVLDGPDIFCFYDSVMMQVPLEEEVQYSWLVNDSAMVSNSVRNTAYSDIEGSYHVAMTNICGTTVTDKVDITHIYLPEERDILLDGDATFCIGDSVVLSQSFLPDETWHWIEREDTIFVSQESVSIKSPGLYSLSVSNVCGTTPANNMVSVNVLDIPPETIVEDFYEICGPGELTVTVGGGEEGNYVWREENNQIIVGLNSSEIVVPLAESKDYFVTITNGYCEGPGNIVDMNVLELPVADAGEDKSMIYGDKVTIGGEHDYPNTFYLWSPDSWMNSNEQPQPVVQPEETTTYILEAIGQNRCSTFDSVTVSVSFDLVIPNTFTPNNDGTNDTWQIRNIEFHPDSKLEVFNRWGTKLYEKTGYQNDWDGRYNGVRLPVDTYFYVIRAEDLPNTYKGSVTILK